MQIAGLIARRIVGFVREAIVGAGERFGLIRFGSRVDVYLPEGPRRWWAKARRVAGETVLADWRRRRGPGPRIGCRRMTS